MSSAIETFRNLPGFRGSADDFTCRCPSHDDAKNSLHVSMGDGGTVLVHCFSGCTPEDIVAALDLKMADLQPPREAKARPKIKRQFDCAYNYHDADGKVVFRVVREIPKGFYQQRPDPKAPGGWRNGLQGVQRVLYRLPEVLRAVKAGERVYLCEGEKDVDSVAALGLCATTNPGGIGAWRSEYADTLKGANVCVLADNDRPGIEGARRRALSIPGARLLLLPGLPEHGDVSDWISAGGTAAELQRLASEAVPPSEDDGEGEGEDVADFVPRFEVFGAADFDALDLRRSYHIPGILAAGPVPTVLAGSFKTLKTSISADLLFSLATASPFLNEYDVTKPVNVLLMSGESGGFALQNLIRRIAASRGMTPAAAGDRLRICTAVPGLSCAQDMLELERLIVEHEIEVLAIDPMYLAMRGMHANDAGNVFAVGELLQPLTELAQRTGCTPIIVHHNGRGATRANAGEPAELGDIAWAGFPEWAGQWILLSRREKFDPDSDGRHALWLTAGGRDGHAALVGVDVYEGRQEDEGGRRWQVSIVGASAARASAMDAERTRREEGKAKRDALQLERDTAAIVAALKAAEDGATKRQLRDGTGIRTARFDAAFAAVLSRKMAEPTTIRARNNQEYDGYKLAPGRTGTHWDSPGTSQ